MENLEVKDVLETVVEAEQASSLSKVIRIGAAVVVGVVALVAIPKAIKKIKSKLAQRRKAKLPTEENVESEG